MIMKILSWNIRQGGSRERINNIVDSLLFYNADVIILIEYQKDKTPILLNKLKNTGYKYYHESKSPDKANGILIASKSEFDLLDNNFLPKAAHRWVEIYIKDIKMKLLAIHIPNSNDQWDKVDFWQTVNGYAKENRSDKTMIVGDFNTGLLFDAEGNQFKNSKFMEELVSIGWKDGWRLFHKDKREYTWYSNMENGFRIDHVFVNDKTVKDLLNVRYEHGPREEKVSDHSVLLLEVI